jgi:hypothetical protein
MAAVLCGAMAGKSGLLEKIFPNSPMTFSF